MRTAHRAVILLGVLVLCRLVAVAGPEVPPGPQLTTLRLDGTLTAWGRIGGVAVDRLGFLYVSNFAETVWKIDPAGGVRELATGLYGASGNAVDGRGDLLQASFDDHRIWRIGRDGEKTLWVENGLRGPVGIAVAGDGTAYVCNCLGNSLSRITAEGAVGAFADSDLFACPNGLTFDDAGDLYVTNFSNDVLVRVRPDGTAERFATVAPTEGYSAAAIAAGVEGSAHVAFAAGAFWITKIKTNRLYRVARDGAVSAFAGTGETGLADGPAASATLARPNGIAAYGSVLFLNNLDGKWRDPPTRGRLVIRRLDVAGS